MIDCDSFQITEGGKSYLCPVGVPEFTPPELQGGNFANKLRTPQHDAFGLAILIFYLLFLGRHPFMGLYDIAADEIVPLDRAIAGYRFPYVISETSAESRIPAAAPRLSDFPSNVSELFKRSFTRDALTKGRPSAHEWVIALTSLVPDVKRCRVNPSHEYYSGLAQCPWCRFEGAIGTPIFGIRITTVVDAQFDMTAAWAQIDAVTATPEQLEVRVLDSMCALHLPIPSVHSIAKRRRLFRLISLATIGITSLVAVVELLPFFAILAIVVALVAARKLWMRGAALCRPIEEEFLMAESAYKALASNLRNWKIRQVLSAKRKRS